MTPKPKRPPELTDKHSRKFWEKHAAELWRDDTLTARDIESFALLCQVFGRLQRLAAITDPANYRAALQFTNLLKQYQQLSARFGLIGPRGRPEKPKASLQEILDRALSTESDTP